MTRPCLERNCPELTDKGSRCPAHTRLHDRTRRPSSTQRYGPGFGRRHKQAVEAEPWCHNPKCPYDDAGTPSNPLTADHLTREVYGPLHALCRSCNSARGNRAWA